MSFLEASILGLVQGVTEFLPISSSGHLIIFESLLGLDTKGLLIFDIVVHLGTLLAIIIYFWNDISSLTKAFFRFLGGKQCWKSPEIQLIAKLIVATIPAVVFVLLLGDKLESTFRAPTLIALLFFVTAIWFVIAEQVSKRKSQNTSEIEDLKWGQAIFVGLVQAVAILPGISRSGSTISMGITVGLSRYLAARFSFLLGAIALAGAGCKLLLDFQSDPSAISQQEILTLSVGFVTSFLSGYLTVAFLMKILKTRTLYPFAIYLVVMGAFVLFLNQ